MSFVVVTLVIGLVLLLVTSVVALHRRGAQVAGVQQIAAEREHSIHARARELDEEFTVSLLNGEPYGEAVAKHIQHYRALVPEFTANRLWSPDDLRSVQRAFIEQRVAAVSRQTLFPFALAAVLIVGATVTLSYLAYSFETSQPIAVPTGAPLGPLATLPSAPHVAAASLPELTLPPLPEPLPVLAPQPPAAVPAGVAPASPGASGSGN